MMKKAFVVAFSIALVILFPFSVLAETADVPFHFNLAPAQEEGQYTYAISSPFSSYTLQEIGYMYTCVFLSPGSEKIMIIRSSHRFIYLPKLVQPSGSASFICDRA